MSASLELIKLGLSGIAGGGLSGLLSLYATSKKNTIDLQEQISLSIKIVTEGMRHEIERQAKDIVQLRQDNLKCERTNHELQVQVDMLLRQFVPTYKPADLRRYIDGKFYDAFPDGEQPARGPPGSGEGGKGGSEGSG